MQLSIPIARVAAAQAVRATARTFTKCESTLVCPALLFVYIQIVSSDCIAWCSVSALIIPATLTGKPPPTLSPQRVSHAYADHSLMGPFLVSANRPQGVLVACGDTKAELSPAQVLSASQI